MAGLGAFSTVPVVVTPEESWDSRRPWTIPAEALVLYRTEHAWRFAVANAAGGIIDGRLPDTPIDAPASVAMAELVRRTEKATGRSYAATWNSDRPGWWSAQLVATQRTES